MVQSCAVGKTEAKLRFLWEGTRLPLTAWQWSAHYKALQPCAQSAVDVFRHYF